MDRAAQRAEVDHNYDVFMRQLASLLPEHRNQYALMKSGAIVGFFDTLRELLDDATARFGDEPYSIQEVTDEPIDLGFFSHVAIVNAGH